MIQTQCTRHYPGVMLGRGCTDNWQTRIIQNIHTLLRHQHKIWLRTALFWAVTQRGVVIPYRRFGTTYRSRQQDWILHPWRWNQIVCPETSVRNYHCSLRNSPEERSYDLSRGRSLQFAYYMRTTHTAHTYCLRKQSVIFVCTGDFVGTFWAKPCSSPPLSLATRETRMHSNNRRTGKSAHG